jgi:hypothetical protein
MRVNRIVLVIVLLAVSGLASACGPLRLDDTPQIKGTVVAIDGDTIGVKHKTGGTYYLQVTPETTIVNRRQPGTTRLCAGQRATVLLGGPRRFTASSITLWSGDCK